MDFDKIESDTAARLAKIDVGAIVHDAAARLDTACPGWHTVIRPERLRMLSCGACVIGQIMGSSLLPGSSFDDTWARLAGPWHGDGAVAYNPYAARFVAGSVDLYGEAVASEQADHLLRAAWTSEVHARLTIAAPAQAA